MESLLPTPTSVAHASSSRIRAPGSRIACALSCLCERAKRSSARFSRSVSARAPPARELAQAERSHAHAHEPPDGVPERAERAADLALAPLAEHQHQP